MINGFNIEIKNESAIEHEIPLFIDFNLPDGLSIKVVNGEYNYDLLTLMAKSKGYMGSGFNTSIIKKVKILNKNQWQEIEVENFNPDYKVIVDGIENYISVVIPPYANGFFQLMPWVK